VTTTTPTPTMTTTAAEVLRHVRLLSSRVEERDMLTYKGYWFVFRRYNTQCKLYTELNLYAVSYN
jgi:hypothetical protein